MKKKYKVVITETLSKVFEIEAGSKQEAEEKARLSWSSAEDDYILGADDFTGVEIEVM